MSKNYPEFVIPQVAHRRYDPLMGDWIIVSPHRISRPWSGHVEVPHNNQLVDGCLPKNSPINPLSPGGIRASGVITPDYTSTYMFPNDFAALVNKTSQLFAIFVR
ncbi:hypothetical protein PHET_12184 [Paragonimus heterotremus]|uniref:Galactose-1-phosphate uridyl transferase N-terminal domain-containing protein n=1 Tax=Paragonimus heterotremus TaxID=100268 RepID=A0A8J4WCL8_9TREM|nr:hypothetical protein PHET_12184 [Paragonimus heterotremus]